MNEREVNCWVFRPISRLCSLQSVKTNGSPTPTFATDEEQICFLTTFPIHPGFTGSFDPVNDLENDPENLVELTASEHKVLSAIRQDASASYGKNAVRLGFPERTAKRSIQSLKKKGIICREGPDKTGKWIILK